MLVVVVIVVHLVSCEGSCLNGGKCIQDGVLSRCTCTHGYQGDRCQFRKCLLFSFGYTLI